MTAAMTLRGVAHTLRDRIGPALEDGFAQEANRLAGLLLSITANGLDDVVEIRVDEIGRLRALFAEAAPLFAGEPLGATLSEAARGEEPGLRVSVLDREIGRLRRVLIDLHAAVETREDAAAAEVDRAIWRLLRDVDRARAPRS